MSYFICSVIAHVSQPHNTLGLIIVVYVFGFVWFDKYLDFINFERGQGPRFSAAILARTSFHSHCRKNPMETDI